MKFELGLLTRDPTAAGIRAAQIEELGFDGTFSFEGPHGPFQPLVLAAAATEQLELSTAIAVAFARSPMIMAQEAQDLQRISAGRFRLGLGSQIRQHIERRFDMPWSAPAARMREYVLAIRAIWHTWSTGEPLAFEGEFYRHDLMPPFFNPGANPFGDPTIAVAGVGEKMVAVAGEVADELPIHPFHTPAHLEAVTLPALERGLAAADRTVEDISITCQTMVMIGRDEDEVRVARDRCRAQLAFYGSTPAYRGVLDHHGYGDLQPELRTMTRENRWAEMSALIDDELVDLVGVSGSPEEVGKAVAARNGPFADRTAFVLYNEAGDAGLPELLEAARAG
ncbi:MAG: TIGR03617 family F420-dependent LLM class oxidoreductase [Nitriliruptorales bacterium]|nr:TIGR03617 family F420-dependent LLM class oxidoreductase [Nitriliruptorales bacterium]